MDCFFFVFHIEGKIKKTNEEETQHSKAPSFWSLPFAWYVRVRGQIKGQTQRTKEKWSRRGEVPSMHNHWCWIWQEPYRERRDYSFYCPGRKVATRYSNLVDLPSVFISRLPKLLPNFTLFSSRLELVFIYITSVCIRCQYYIHSIHQYQGTQGSIHNMGLGLAKHKLWSFAASTPIWYSQEAVGSLNSCSQAWKSLCSIKWAVSRSLCQRRPTKSFSPCFQPYYPLIRRTQRHKWLITLYACLTSFVANVAIWHNSKQKNLMVSYNTWKSLLMKWIHITGSLFYSIFSLHSQSYRLGNVTSIW